MSSHDQDRGARRTRVTQPDRRFGPEELAALAREDRRKLAQVLLTDTGARGIEFQTVAAYDELVLEIPMLWRARLLKRPRLLMGPVGQPGHWNASGTLRVAWAAIYTQLASGSRVSR